MTTCVIRARVRASGYWLATSLVLLTLTQTGSTARAASPYSATYSHDRDAIFWILHVADTHIGATWIEGPDASDHFAWVLDEGKRVIDPELIVVTGDLCDGSRFSIPASGQDQAEWDEYAALLDDAEMSPDYFLDLPGNHDGYGDIGFSHYLASSMNGRVQGVPYRALSLSFPFGDYLLFGFNTAGQGSGPFIENPAFTEEELWALETSMTAADYAQLVFFFGHHPITRPDRSDQVIDSAQREGAFWFHGHVHSYGSYLTEEIVAAQVDTLGKGDTNNVAVIAVDNNAVSYAITSTEDPWPLIAITAPANRILDSGAANPYAYEVCNSSVANPVRALVFDAGEVSEVTFSAGTAEAVAMTRDDREPRLWYGVWDTTGLPPGPISLTVTAYGSTVRTTEISATVADVDCPASPTPQPPDAGPPDARPPDARPVDGMPGPDTGSAAGVDGGPVEVDGSTGPDAVPAVDAGITIDPLSPADADCGCRTTGGSRAQFLSLLALFLLVRRRRI